MESVMKVYNWVMSNKVEIINVISYVIAGATIIVKMTPTQKDDNVLNKVVAFISKYIALNK